MVEEGYRLPEAKILDTFWTEIFIVNKADSVAYVVKSLGVFHNLIEKVTFFEKDISRFLAPKIEKIMLEKFELSHQLNFLSS